MAKPKPNSKRTEGSMTKQGDNQMETKAEFIIRAINSYEALLTEAKEALDILGSFDPVDSYTERTYLRLETAIAQAEGK